MIATRLMRWVCHPANLEAIEGDLTELYGDRPPLREVVSVCLRQPRTALRLLAASIAVLALVGPDAPPVHYMVHATDPAGEFALEIHDGRAVAARIDGVLVRAEELVQRGDTVLIRDFRVAIKPEGGITWFPRPSRSR